MVGEEDDKPILKEITVIFVAIGLVEWKELRWN